MMLWFNLIYSFLLPLLLIYCALRITITKTVKVGRWQPLHPPLFIIQGSWAVIIGVFLLIIGTYMLLRVVLLKIEMISGMPVDECLNNATVRKGFDCFFKFPKS